jgi:hypothetical protein
MAKRIHKFVLLTGLITTIAVPVWGKQSQPKQSNPQEQAETRSTRQLPEGGSELPLLSVIGMGILSGGLVSAMRTRPAKVR